MTHHRFTALLAVAATVTTSLLAAADADADNARPGHDPGVTWTVSLDGHSVDLPEYAEEDGNVDGLPCLWLDDDTGTRYYVTSENYR